MANVSFANLDEAFDVYTNFMTYAGASDFGRQPQNFSWYSPATNDVDFDGTGFTYGNMGRPVSGTVTGFRLDLANDSENTPEVAISGLSFDLGLLSSLGTGLTADQENNLIWQTLLAGDDTIDLGASAGSPGRYIRFAGDARDVASGSTIYAGNDIITGHIGGGMSGQGDLSGDVFNVFTGSTVFAGNDTLTVSGSNTESYVEGDANSVFGVLFGGNDKIATITASAAVKLITGDAYWNTSTGVLHGGNDVIATAGGTTIYGETIISNGIVDGGNDLITGGSLANGLYGDVGTNAAPAHLRGGNDTIHGMGGDDYIYGDWSNNAGSAVGGNDSLFGEEGVDHIFGNDGADFLRGDAGGDFLDGGTGFDTASYQYGTGATINTSTGLALDGEGGTDTIANIEQFIGSAYYRDVFTGTNGAQYFVGLGGNDYVIDDGTGGGDNFNGGDGFDTIAFYNRTAATVNLATGSAIVDGVSNSITAFEEVYGSNTGGDTIVGNSGNNTFWGFGGNDVLVGGQGLDTLSGGLGNDTFGFNATDMQAGVWDVISDFHEVVGTDRDILYFNGVPGASLVVGEGNGGVYVSTSALGGTGGVFIANFTANQLADQLMFT